MDRKAGGVSGEYKRSAAVELVRREVEAAKWRIEHMEAFVRALHECTDIQTLRALAHRLGYKEGT